MEFSNLETIESFIERGNKSNRRSKEGKENKFENERMKRQPFYILSCDGGGVRSLATAHFLLAFEKHMKTIDPDFKIYEFFDMYAGSSAGAILLSLSVYGQKEMSDLVEIYHPKILKKIFARSFLDSVFGKCQAKPLYDGKAKRKIIGDVVQDSIYREVPGNKHMVVPAYDVVHKSKIFYSGDNYSALVKTIDVIDAASAAPVYFPAVKVDDHWFMDGGIVANNPTMCALTTAKKILGNSNRPIVVISVGTGSIERDVDEKASANFGGIQWILHDIFGIPMDESLVEVQAKLLVPECNYLRINSDLGDIDSGLDNVNTENMKKLQNLGTGWWEKFGDDMMKILENHPSLDSKALAAKSLKRKKKSRVPSVFTFGLG